MEELNQIWEVIEDTIIKVGKKVLPSKVIKNELGKQNPRLKEYSRSVANWRKWNKLINRINQLVETQI
ncbi:40797_t:CDS:2, partial [Gigaspora margarita]